MTRTYFLPILFICQMGLSQPIKTPKFNHITSLNTSLVEVSVLKFEASSDVGSNHFNTSMFTNYLFGSQFTSDAKNSFLEKEVDRSKAAFNAQARIAYDLENGWIDNVFVSGESKAYLNSSGSGNKLMLFGNKAYANSQVKIENLDFLAYTAFDLGVSKDFSLSPMISITLDAAVSLANRVNYVSASEVTIFTHEYGDYIDLNAREMVVGQPSDGIDGVGANLGLLVEGKVGSVNWNIGIQDLRPMLLLNAQDFTLDTTLRFEGVVADFSDLTSDNFANSVESEYRSIYEKNLNDRETILLPSVITIGASKNLPNSNALGVSFSLLGFGKYGFVGSVFYDILLKDNIALSSNIGYGDFRGFYVSEGVELSYSKFNVFIQLEGVSSLVSPNNLGFLGFRTGFSVPLNKEGN